jgi:hypothetical protein
MPPVATINPTGERMKNMQFGDTRCLGMLVSGLVILSACVATPSGAQDVFSQRNANAFDPVTIDAIGDKVAEWQIANLDDLSYVTKNTTSTENRRGWVHGALYVGMMNWAALPGNDEYFAPLRKISEEEEWQLGDRLFHGDDHIVGQLYLDFYEREKDPQMIDHTIRQLNQILVANPSDTLEFLGDGIRGVGRACQVRWCWCDALLW